MGWGVVYSVENVAFARTKTPLQNSRLSRGARKSLKKSSVFFVSILLFYFIKIFKSEELYEENEAIISGYA